MVKYDNNKKAIYQGNRMLNMPKEIGHRLYMKATCWSNVSTQENRIAINGQQNGQIYQQKDHRL